MKVVSCTLYHHAKWYSDLKIILTNITDRMEIWRSLQRSGL